MLVFDTSKMVTDRGLHKMEGTHIQDSWTVACSKIANSKSAMPSFSPRKKPVWVVADWKHRVPESPLPGPAPAAGSLNGGQRAKVVEERRTKLHSEYACVHDTIDNILNRCKQVQQRLGSSSTTAPSGCCHSPTFLSARSKVFFSPPTEQPEAAADSAWQAAAGCRPGTGQQQRPVTDSWAGAVDLNPGFSFAPGSPERIAASCPDELPMILARVTGLIDDLKHVDLSKLYHREALQAGIQQLNGEFYGAMVNAAIKQHHHQQKLANRPLGVIPASWQSKTSTAG